MIDSNDNYPMGAANDPRAPYNEVEIPKRVFNIYISQSLSKDTTVLTNNYNIVGNYLDPEDGGCEEYIDTRDTNWMEAYKEEHLTPLELINKFKSMLIDTLESKDNSLISPTNNKSIKWLIKECSNWIEDETDIEEQ